MKDKNKTKKQQSKIVNQQFKESEQKIKNLIEATTDWIWEVDEEGVYTYVSPKVKDVLGYEISEVLGKTPFDFMSEEESKKVGKIFRKKIIKKETFRGLENKNYHKDGHLVVLETNGVPVFDEKNRLKGYIGFDRDITEYKKLEEKLHFYGDIVVNMAEGVYLVGQDNMTIKYVNSKFEKMFGYGAGELIGKNVSIVNAPGGKTSGKKRDEIAAIVNETGEWHGEIENIKKDGTRFWCYANVSVFDHSELGPVMISVHADITKQKEIDEERRKRMIAETKTVVEHAKAVELKIAYNQLKKTKDKLVRIEKLAVLGKLAGGIAHELRTPLGVIRNSAYFLRGKLKEFIKDEKVKKHLNILDNEVKISDKIIEDIIVFTQVRVPSVIKINCKEILDNVKNRISIPKGVDLIINFNKEFHEMIFDKDQAIQLFHNIILNSIQAMPEGGKITINFLEKKDYREISIKDSGIGISKNNLECIFEPLFTTKIKGLGLGLAICENIVKNHGGIIKIKSKEGQGTELIIKLPKE